MLTAQRSAEANSTAAVLGATCRSLDSNTGNAATAMEHARENTPGYGCGAREGARGEGGESFRRSDMQRLGCGGRRKHPRCPTHHMWTRAAHACCMQPCMPFPHEYMG